MHLRIRVRADDGKMGDAHFPQANQTDLYHGTHTSFRPLSGLYFLKTDDVSQAWPKMQARSRAMNSGGASGGKIGAEGAPAPSASSMRGARSASASAM